VIPDILYPAGEKPTSIPPDDTHNIATADKDIPFGVNMLVLVQRGVHGAL